MKGIAVVALVAAIGVARIAIELVRELVAIRRRRARGRAIRGGSRWRDR